MMYFEASAVWQALFAFICALSQAILRQWAMNICAIYYKLQIKSFYCACFQELR